MDTVIELDLSFVVALITLSATHAPYFSSGGLLLPPGAWDEAGRTMTVFSGLLIRPVLPAILVHLFRRRLCASLLPLPPPRGGLLLFAMCRVHGRSGEDTTEILLHSPSFQFKERGLLKCSCHSHK